MAADGGGMFWVGQPLTSPQKKDRGLKMAVDDGSVFFGGIPLTQGGNIAGAVRQKRRDSNDGVGNVAFNWITSADKYDKLRLSTTGGNKRKHNCQGNLCLACILPIN